MLCSSNSLQMAFIATVYFMFVLSTCRTQHCGVQMSEKMKNRSVILRNIDIKLCESNCQDNFIFASCRTSSVRPQNHLQARICSCNTTTCSPGMRCLVTPSGKAVCVQGSTKCPAGFQKHEDSCYWFSNKKGTFDEAMSRCNFLGADLASITSREEDVFIKWHATLFGRAPQYFLGGTDLCLQGRWAWLGNRPFTYTNWASKQPGPANNSEHCLALDICDRYRWHDYECNFRAKFICKMNLIN